MVDIINDFFAHATNVVNTGKYEVEFGPINKLLINCLKVLQREGYVEKFEIINNERGGKIRVKFTPNFNKGNAIKPRFPVGYRELEKWEKRYLPAKGFGILLISTDKGVMTNEDAKELKVGGVLIAYVY